MIKKITQYLLQRRCALSLLLMLMLLQPAMAQTQDRRMYARLDRETQTLTLYYDKNEQASDIEIDDTPLWPFLKEELYRPWSLTRVSRMHVPNHVIPGFGASKV